MAIKTIIESKKCTENILSSRRATNENNLKEDIEKWNKIILFKNENWLYEIEDRKERNDIKNVIKTVRSRIKSNYEFLGLDNGDEIHFDEVKKQITDYLNSPKSVQISLCRNSTRQTIDELIQIETLKKYIKKEFDIINLTNGLYSLRDGDIKDDTSKVGEARSIDVKIQSDNFQYNAWGFLKVSMAGGSVGELQANEASLFLDQAKLYCDKHKDNTIFFVQMDGTGEKHIPMLREKFKIYKNYNIVIGNTEYIIDFFNNLSLTNSHK